MIRREGITVFGTTPSLLSLLIEVPGFEQCSSLRMVVSGGEVLTSDLQKRFFARSHARLLNIYGPTETTISATHWECCRGHCDPQVPIGFPVAGARIYLLNSQGEPVPDGSEGEIYIGGPGVGLGYHHRDDLNRERFLKDPSGSDPGGRLYRTGESNSSSLSS